MARGKYVNPYDQIQWIQLDDQYKSSGLGGPILSSISYQWAQLLGNYNNVVQAAIGNLIHLSFAVEDEDILRTLIISKSLEKFDKEETGTYEELKKKRIQIENGYNLKVEYNKYLEQVVAAKHKTIENLINNLKLDYKNECFSGLVYHDRDFNVILAYVMDLCSDVKYLDPTKFSDSDVHDADEGPWEYDNLLRYFTSKISYIV